MWTPRPRDRISRGSDFRLDRIRHFVYIDDFGMLGLERHKQEMTIRLARSKTTTHDLWVLGKRYQPHVVETLNQRGVVVVIHQKSRRSRLSFVLGRNKSGLKRDLGRQHIK